LEDYLYNIVTKVKNNLTKGAAFFSFVDRCLVGRIDASRPVDRDGERIEQRILLHRVLPTESGNAPNAFCAHAVLSRSRCAFVIAIDRDGLRRGILTDC